MTQEVTTTTERQERRTMAVSGGLNFFSPQDDLLGSIDQLRRTKYLPQQLIDRYIQEALKGASVKRLDEDGPLFAEITGFPGVWASDEDLTACVAQLRDALFDWIVIKIEQDDRDLPVVAGISLNVI